VYRIAIAAITASTLTSVAFAGCREPARIFRLNGCDRSEQIIYGSPAPYTAITKHTKYYWDHYGNQTYDTKGQPPYPPYPPYYPYPEYAPSYVLVINSYDGPLRAKSRNHRHTLKENALTYNEHTIRRITHGVKPARRALPPFSARASAPTRSANVTSAPVAKVVEVAGQRVGIVSADAVNAIAASDTTKALSFVADAGALEQSARDTSTNPNSLAEALAAVAGALAAVLMAWFLGLTPLRIPGFTRKRY